MEQLDVLRNLIWNLQFDEAERSFKEKKDTDVEYALHYAEVIFTATYCIDNSKIQVLRALLSEDSQAIEEAFTRLSHLEHLVSNILSTSGQVKHLSLFSHIFQAKTISIKIT